jgi:hypothetical protein
VTTILVCGGRSYGRVPSVVSEEERPRLAAQACRERARLYRVLEHAPERLGLTRLVCGDQTGADFLAVEWAKEATIPFKVYPADWGQHGNKAGPIRNRQMLDEEQPAAVIAFPGAKGTRNMVGLAEKAGVLVIKVDWA